MRKYFLGLSFLWVSCSIAAQLDSIPYQFDGYFYESNPDLPFRTNQVKNISLFEDLTKAATMDSFLQNSSSLISKDPETIPEVKKVYWLRTRLIGNNRLNGSQFFQVSVSPLEWGYYSFDYIDTYELNRGKSNHQKTGDKVPLSKRPFNFWAKFISIDISPMDTIDLFIRMENVDHRIPLSNIELHHIDPTSLFPQQVNEAWINGLFYGVLGIQFLYFLFLFFIEKERIHFYLALTILGLFITIGFSNGNFNRFVPFPNWSDYDFVLIFLGMFLAQVGALKFTQTYFNFIKTSIFSKWIIPTFISFASFVYLFLVLCWEYPQNFGFLKNILFSFYFLLTIACTVILFLMTITAKKQKVASKELFLLAFLPLIFIVFSNYLFHFSNGTLRLDFSNPESIRYLFIDLVKYSIIWMLTLFAISIGNRTNLLKAEKQAALQKNLTNQKQRFQEQKQINQAISRFVPNEFLAALGKSSITQVSLGDHMEKNVTVFFSDIRSYTTLSEQMTPSENFKFVQAYNSRMGPIIESNHGFINQYLGDGLMAIFPQTPDDALKAAIQMQDTLRQYNLERISKGKTKIQVGMGLHTGSLIMGIIGHNNRMDAATISDSVNTAARIEGLTKHYGASILLSSDTLEQLSNPTEFNFRYLGQVQVKGKQHTIKIHECIDGDTPNIKDLKITTLPLFEEGVQQYFNQYFSQAATNFNSALQQNVNDKAATLFFNKAKRLIIDGVREGWTGIEMMDK